MELPWRPGALWRKFISKIGAPFRCRRAHGVSPSYPSMLDGKGSHSEGMLRGLDYLLAEAGARGLKVGGQLSGAGAALGAVYLQGSGLGTPAAKVHLGLQLSHPSRPAAAATLPRSCCPSPAIGRRLAGWTSLPT